MWPTLRFHRNLEESLWIFDSRIFAGLKSFVRDLKIDPPGAEIRASMLQARSLLAAGRASM
jgi:hypothetical protein